MKRQPSFPFRLELNKAKVTANYLHKTTINTNKLGLAGTRSCSGLATSGVCRHVPISSCLMYYSQGRQHSGIRGTAGYLPSYIAEERGMDEWCLVRSLSER